MTGGLGWRAKAVVCLHAVVNAVVSCSCVLLGAARAMLAARTQLAIPDRAFHLGPAAHRPIAHGGFLTIGTAADFVCWLGQLKSVSKDLAAPSSVAHLFSCHSFASLPTLGCLPGFARLADNECIPIRVLDTTTTVRGSSFSRLCQGWCLVAHWRCWTRIVYQMTHWVPRIINTETSSPAATATAAARTL